MLPVIYLDTAFWAKCFFFVGSDALHLLCALANGFREVYTKDRPMLAAAAAFGIQGRDIL
jgi:hypothetical protein